MHELSLAEGLAELVEERTAGRQVVAVHLRVGRESGVMADALAFCWDVVTTATPLAGSRLVIEETAGDELAVAYVELTPLVEPPPVVEPRGRLRPSVSRPTPMNCVGLDTGSASAPPGSTDGGGSTNDLEEEPCAAPAAATPRS